MDLLVVSYQIHGISERVQVRSFCIRIDVASLASAKRKKQPNSSLSTSGHSNKQTLGQRCGELFHHWTIECS